MFAFQKDPFKKLYDSIYKTLLDIDDLKPNDVRSLADELFGIYVHVIMVDGRQRREVLDLYLRNK
jgi:hypothetical protein